VALEGHFRAYIGLLQLHVPVAEVGQRNGFACNSAPHKIARRQYLELAIKIAQLGLTFETKQPFEPIHICRYLGEVMLRLRYRV
jgi:hypothetical protein